MQAIRNVLITDATGAPSVPRFDRQSPAINAITQRLRAEFDPAGIFNPGRMG